MTRDERRAYKAPLRGLRNNSAPLALARMVPDSQEHASIEPMHLARDYITSFDGPIAGVWGLKDPVLGSLYRYHSKILPNMRLIETNAGHFLQEEVPEPIARQIEWVSREAKV